MRKTHFVFLCFFVANLIWWLWVELNHQPSAYETLALPLSYTAIEISWKPAEELNLVPVRPALEGSV